MRMLVSTMALRPPYRIKFRVFTGKASHGKNSTGRVFAPAPRWSTPAAPPEAAASGPARTRGKPLKRRWQQRFAAPARLGKQMAGLEPAACGGCKDVSAAGAAGRAVPEDLREAWDERVAIMVADGGVPRAEAARLAGAALQAQWGARCTAALYG